MGLLLLAHVGDDQVDLLVAESLDGRHVPEVPVMGRRPLGHRGSERRVGVVVGCVDLRQVRRALVGAAEVGAVAGRARLSIQLCATGESLARAVESSLEHAPAASATSSHAAMVNVVGRRRIGAGPIRSTVASAAVALPFSGHVEVRDRSLLSLLR